MQIDLQVATITGHVEKLTLDAPSAPTAVRTAVQRGYRVLAVLQRPSVAISGNKHQVFSIVLFSQELLALLEAGLTLIESLETLRNKETKSQIRSLLDQILSTLREGKNFSDALTIHPHHFPELYIAMIRAAERSSNLSDALSRYIAYQLQFDMVRKKLVSASIYPLILLTLGGVVTLFLLGYVVPKFSAVYEGSVRAIPWQSEWLLAMGRVIHHHWLVSISIFIGAIVLLIYTVVNPVLRSATINQLLRLPWIATRIQEFRLARFYRTMGVLLRAGIPLSQALAKTSGLFPAADAARLGQVKRTIEEGLTLSQALEQQGLATAVASSLIRVGEKSGRLADMLEHTARFHDEELGRWIEWVVRLAEPILMIILGLAVGGVVVLLYLPIFDLAGSLQ